MARKGAKYQYRDVCILIWEVSAMQHSYGLILDVDGVIADTESVNRRVSVQVFDDLFGVKGVKDEDFTEGLGPKTRDMTILVYSHRG